MRYLIPIMTFLIADMANSTEISVYKDRQDITVEVDEMIECAATFKMGEEDVHFSYYFDEFEKEYYSANLSQQNDLKYFYHSCRNRSGHTCLDFQAQTLFGRYTANLEATTFTAGVELSNGTYSYKTSFSGQFIYWFEEDSKFTVKELSDNGSMVCSRSLDTNFFASN
jgi:hypothetical protein